MSRWRAGAMVLLVSVCVALLAGCARGVTLSGTRLQPAGLPLRAFPNVLILRGHLDEEVRIGRGLAEHLRRLGHIRTRQMSEEALREWLSKRPLPPAAVLVEVQLDVEELIHQQFGAPMQTICDSLSCYVMPSSAAQDMPVLRATLALTVRDAATMVVRQQVRLRALELGASSEDMRREATLTLIQRARVLVDHRRLTAQVELFAPDVEGVGDAVDVAEEGDWRGAQERLERVLSRRGAGLPARTRARLLHDLAQARRYAAEASDPEALVLARQAVAEAVRLDPETPNHAEVLRAVRRDLRNAQAIRVQRAAAARNYRLAQAPRAIRRETGRP